MKRFQFRLQTLLNLKRQQERLAELRQAEAAARTRHAMAERDALNDEYSNAAQSIADRRLLCLHAATLLAEQLRLQKLRERVEQADDRVNLAAQSLNEVTEIRKSLSREVASIDSLRDRAWQEHRRETQGKQFERIDEFVTHRWRQNDAHSTEGDDDGKAD